MTWFISLVGSLYSVMALPLSQDKSLLHIKTSRQPGYKTDISVTPHFCGFVRLTSLFLCPFLLLFTNEAFWFPKEELRDLKGVILFISWGSGSRSSHRERPPWAQHKHVSAATTDRGQRSWQHPSFNYFHSAASSTKQCALTASVHHSVHKRLCLSRAIHPQRSSPALGFGWLRLSQFCNTASLSACAHYVKITVTQL